MHIVDLTFNEFSEQCYVYCEQPSHIDFEQIELDRLISKIKNHELKLDVFPKFCRQLTMDKDKGGKKTQGQEDMTPHNKKARKTLKNPNPNGD